MTYQEYENQLLQNISHFVVTQHLGRGQYKKTECTDIEHARTYKKHIINDNPLARVAIYACCTPPSRPLVNIIVE